MRNTYFRVFTINCISTELQMLFFTSLMHFFEFGDWCGATESSSDRHSM